MKLGLLTVMFSDKPLKDVLELVRPLGLSTVELGTGNYPGDAHAPLDALLKSKPKRKELLAMLEGEDLEISALSLPIRACSIHRATYSFICRRKKS